MTRTQILLPDEVYQRARSVAEAKEISLAELARRGLELILDQYPSPEAIRQEWQLPLLSGMGWRGLDDTEIKLLARKTALEEDLEERQVKQE